MAKVPTSEELITSFNQGTLAIQMAHRFGLKDKAEIELVQTRLIELHNAEELNLLQLGNINGLPELKATDFFMAAHFFCRIIPELEATPEQVMHCTEALVTRGGDDGMANEPNGAFRAWCAKKQERAREVIAAAHSGDCLATRNLTFALEAINAISEARQIALAYDDARRASTIIALGRIEDNDADSCAETFTAFSQILHAGADDKLRASMLHATAAILARNIGVIPFDVAGLVNRLVEDAGPFIVHQSAHILWRYDKALEPNMVAVLLRVLAHLNPANKGTIREINLGLRSLVQLGYAEAAINYFTQLFSHKGTSLQFEDFETFISELLSGPAELVSRVIVQWLLLSVPSLCEGIANSFGNDLKGPPLDLQREDLSILPAAQIFLCRKAIGWFFFKPITAASVIVSVLRVCDDETALKVQKLLVEALLINYRGIRHYLESLDPDDAAKIRVSKCLAENDAYLRELQAIPLIKELQPSEHQRGIEHVRMLNQMRDVNKQAHRESVFFNLVKRSVLLYGNSSLSFINEGDGVRRPVELDLMPHGISFEMPATEITDPVGLQQMLRIFRAQRLSS